MAVKILVIYYRDDYNEIEDKIKILREQGSKAEFIVHQETDAQWRKQVQNDIRDCNCVVMFAGKKTWNSPKVAWEIRVAKWYKKTIYVIRLLDEVPLHEQLFRKLPVRCKKSNNKKADQFLQKQKNRKYTYERRQEEFNEELLKYEKKDYGIFQKKDGQNKPINEKEKEILFGQYELFVKTSEDLIQRRQTANGFYISINAALLALGGTLLESLNELESSFALFSRLGVLFALCLIGSFISYSWRKMLISYGQLNKGKIDVITELEKHLPASMFAPEWKMVKNPMNGYVHKSYTEREKDIPRIFMWGYGVALVIILFVTGCMLWKYMSTNPDSAAGSGYSLDQFLDYIFIR